MTGTRWDRIKQLFARAEPLDAAAQARFLESSCGDDAALRAELESLLASEAIGGRFLEPPDPDDVSAVSGMTAGGLEPGTRVGRYEIVEPLAEGGMGAVYVARRADDAFEKRVALKVMHRQRSTQRLRRRFDFERQTLATLEHPNITTLLDGGATRDGLPYLVMELVEGEPIVDYVERHAATIQTRLRLFLAACDAVAHAHRRLVVHRDLKPANILVTDDGVVKLLDFGIARLLEPEAAPVPEAATVTGHRALTPEYASPEQIRNEAVTTASDVYSLGVVLYELLTGRRPYRLDGRPPYEAERIICEEDPAPPSSIAPAVRRRALLGDLDTIVLAALAKQTTRRYASVEQLAGDIRRHLDALPIRARKDTIRYRTRKMVQRNRPQVIAGVAAALALIVALVSVSLGLVKSRAGEQAAEQANADAREVIGFYQDMLVSANAYRRGRNVSLLDLVDEAERALPEAVADRPAAEAGIRMALARSYASLMMWRRATPHLEAALRRYRELGSTRRQDRLDLAACLSLLGRAYTHGRRHESVAIQREGLEIRRGLLGDRHPLVAESTGNLGFAMWYATRPPRWDEAEQHYRSALGVCDELGLGATRDAARFSMSLGCMYQTAGRIDDAELYYRRALAIYAELPVTEDLYELTTLSLSGRMLLSAGRLDESERRFEAYLSKLTSDFQQWKRRWPTWQLVRARIGQRRVEDAALTCREALALECEPFEDRGVTAEPTPAQIAQVSRLRDGDGHPDHAAVIAAAVEAIERLDDPASDAVAAHRDAIDAVLDALAGRVVRAPE